MRAILILIVAAVLGFFGFQYLVNGKSPADAISGLTGQAAEMADSATEAAGDVADAGNMEFIIKIKETMSSVR